MRLQTKKQLVLAALPVLVGLSALPSVAEAQSAADTAAARQLATEGIKAFQAGDSAAALEKLERAQALYDAPVHLLYIARAQAKLGKLVEAAETYRRLVRTELKRNDPRAFRDAVASGQDELDELEPRVPTLRIDVEPESISDLEVLLDGQPVPAAALGIDRPANPGQRVVSVRATGFRRADRTVDLGEGTRGSLVVKLEAVPERGADATGGSGVGPSDEGARSKKAAGASGESGTGWFAGLELHVLSPFGAASTPEVYPEPYRGTLPADAIGMGEFFGLGAGLGLRGGLQFGRRYSVVLFVDFSGLASGTRLDDISGYPESEYVEVTSQADAADAGLGGTVSFPFGSVALFGSLDLALHHQFTARQTVSAYAACPDEHENTLTLSGTALRLGGGAFVPISESFRLVPQLMVTLGQFSRLEATTGCAASVHRDAAANVHPFPFVEAGATERSADLNDPKPHGALWLGVGLDFLFWGGKALK
jgi:tetratricopeptide (TPR) repeat protein